MKNIMVRTGILFILCVPYANAQFGLDSLKDKLLGEEKKDEVKEGTATLESEYPVADVFAKLDPLLAIYGSAVLEYMQGYQAFLSAYGETTMAAKAEALIQDLNNGAALDSDMIDRITLTTEELGTEIQILQEKNITLEEEGKAQFADGLEHFLLGVGQTYVLVNAGPNYVNTIKKEVANSLMGGGMAFSTVRTIGKIVIDMPGNIELIYNNLNMIVKYSQDNDIPVPPSVDIVMSGISL